MLNEDKRVGGALSEYEKWRLEKIKKNKELVSGAVGEGGRGQPRASREGGGGGNPQLIRGDGD